MNNTNGKNPQIESEKYEILLKVLGSDDVRVLDQEISYIKVAVNPYDDICDPFSRIVANIRKRKELNLDASDGLEVLTSIVELIFDHHSEDPMCNEWFIEALDLGVKEAECGIGLCYFNNEEFEKAVEVWEPLSVENYVRAELGLGLCYELGMGIEKDEEKAVRLIEEAANRGYSWAQFEYGRLLFLGRYVEENHEQAFQWFLKSASQEYGDGQTFLGICYLDGFGVEEDRKKAIECFEKAVRHDNSIAQETLGECYYEGKGVDVDYGKAFEFFNMAAAKGNTEAQNGLGNCYLEGRGVEKNPEKSVEWFKKAANNGNKNAQKSLGDCYRRGTGVEVDKTKAFDWYQKAAENGCFEAQGWLGACYHYGIGVHKDIDKAIELYKTAAENGVPDAQNALGDCYAEGIGVDKDLETANYWYNVAAEQDDSWGQYNLGCNLFYGNGIKKDVSEAISLLEKAARNDLVKAQLKLGDIYYKLSNFNEYTRFNGKEKEYFRLALYWYKYGAEQGDPKAQYEYGRTLRTDYYYSNNAGPYWREGTDLENGLDLTKEEIKEYKELYPERDKNLQLVEAEAFKWIKKAAENNYLNAILSCAETYFNCRGKDDFYLGVDGEIEKRAKRKAFEYYKRASELGSYYAKLTVAKYYIHGLCAVDRDIDKAVKMIKECSEKESFENEPLLYLVGLYLGGIYKFYSSDLFHYTDAWESNFSREERSKYFDEKEAIRILIHLVEKHNDKKNSGGSNQSFYSLKASTTLGEIKKAKGFLWCIQNGASKWPKFKGPY